MEQDQMKANALALKIAEFAGKQEFATVAIVVTVGTCTAVMGNAPSADLNYECLERGIAAMVNPDGYREYQSGGMAGRLRRVK